MTPAAFVVANEDKHGNRQNWNAAHRGQGKTRVIDFELAPAVEAFALSSQGLPDAAMEQRWSWQGRDVDVRWGFYRTYEELRDLAATIDGERAARGRCQTSAQRALALYHVAYRDLRALLVRVSDHEVDRAPAEGEWPVRAVIEHMMRAERRFLAETVYAVGRYRNGDAARRLPAEALAPYQGEGDASGTAAQILAGYDALHERVLDELSGLSEDDLQAPVIWWYEAGARFQLFRFDAHLREHTIQLEKVLEAIRPRPTDALRTLRLIYQALGAVEGALLGATDIFTARRRELAASIAARTAELAAATKPGSRLSGAQPGSHGDGVT